MQSSGGHRRRPALVKHSVELLACQGLVGVEGCHRRPIDRGGHSIDVQLHLLLNRYVAVIRIEDDFQFVRVGVFGRGEIDAFEYSQVLGVGVVPPTPNIVPTFRSHM